MAADVIVKESKIEGKGVFANRNFKKGEIVVQWATTKILTKEEWENLSMNERKYTVPYQGKYLLQREPACFVNHSCNPNTKVMDSADVAIRDITKGEEITSDYSFSLTPGETFDCNCGADNCVGVLRNSPS